MQPTSQQTAHPYLSAWPLGRPVGAPALTREGRAQDSGWLGEPYPPKTGEVEWFSSLVTSLRQVCLRLSLGTLSKGARVGGVEAEAERSAVLSQREACSLGPPDRTEPQGWVRTGKVTTARA